jgi:UDP:flavonoid glycosyltransferase YjiC (YdhE family)
MAEQLRVMLAAVGWPGHVVPVIALARELRIRGHHVLLETSERWRGVAEELGLGFAPAEERFSFPGWTPEGDPDGGGGLTLAQVVRSVLPTIREFRPDVVVNDLFTLAPSMAAEAAGVRSATLIPHVYPVREPGLPVFPLGLLPARTPLGATAWRALGALQPLLDVRHRRVRNGLNVTRVELGLPARERLHGAISEGLAMVATFPQLEYPRRWPAHVHVTGPMLFELPQPEIELPDGEEPLVVVLSSTGLDPELRLVRVALEALEGQSVRVVATTAGREWSGFVPTNAAVVDWISHPQVLPRASLVVCHGGHGTVSRALAWGKPILVCPAGADMSENGARVTWAGGGLTLARPLHRPGPFRWAVRRLLADERFAARAREIAAWSRENHGASSGAYLVERYAG